MRREGEGRSKAVCVVLGWKEGRLSCSRMAEHGRHIILRSIEDASVSISCLAFPPHYPIEAT